MASIVKRTTSKGEKRLYVKFADRDGKAHWELQPTGLLKEAQARRSQVEALLIEHKGMWPPPGEKRAGEAGRTTLGEYADKWIENHAANLRDRVYANYKASLRLHVKPLLGKRAIDTITAADGRDLVATMRGKKAADSTIRNAIVPLRELLSYAVEDKLLLANPLAGVKLFGNQTPQKREIVPPSHGQVETILAELKSDAREAMQVAAATGARRGELFGLRWADLDFEKNLIRIHSQNYGGKIEEMTKTEAGRRVLPIFPTIRKMLLERKARQPFSRPPDFVFGSSIGTAMDPNNFVRREFKPALKAAGVAGQFTWHDLRHFAVSTLIAQGADIMLLARIAGHKDPSITLRVYAHLMVERVSEAATIYDPLRKAAVDQ